ncbi:MAG: antibiotic biosynthesis monooxygenase family protein [Propionibacteriaceae bacterium]
MINRFRVPPVEAQLFCGQADAAIAVLAGRPGFRTADLGRNVDDTELWSLVTRWDDIGSCRRALGGLEAKLTVVPLLSRAIDEPPGYDDPVASLRWPE